MNEFTRAAVTKYHKCSIWTTEIYYLTVLETESLRSICGQNWFLLRAVSENLNHDSYLPSSDLVAIFGIIVLCSITLMSCLHFTWHFPCVIGVHISSFNKNTSHIGLGHANYILDSILKFGQNPPCINRALCPQPCKRYWLYLKLFEESKLSCLMC